MRDLVFTFLLVASFPPAAFGKDKCAWVGSDSACRKARLGAPCVVNAKAGICAANSHFGQKPRCECVPAPAASAAPSVLDGNDDDHRARFNFDRCDRQESENSCSNVAVGSSCSEDERDGVCAVVSFRGRKSRCKCMLEVSLLENADMPLPCAESDIHGSFAKGGGCNIHGCWAPGGSCNLHGCTTVGECTISGCPGREGSYKCRKE